MDSRRIDKITVVEDISHLVSDPGTSLSISEFYGSEFGEGWSDNDEGVNTYHPADYAGLEELAVRYTEPITQFNMDGSHVVHQPTAIVMAHFFEEG